MKIDLKIIIMLLTAVGMGAAAQLILKIGTNAVGELNNAVSLLSALFTPLVLIGVLIYFGSSLLWLVVLSKSELSYAYPFVAISYALVALLSSILLNESLPLLRIGGITIITAGVIMVSLSK